MTVPFALSIHKFINSVGSDVGFASIIAVAILILLYFAHARETATLRERLDDAHQRIGGLEGRIAQLLQMQTAQRGRVPGAAAPGAVAPVPAPPGLRPAGSVRRIPTPAPAAAPASGAPTAAAAATHDESAVPSAPAGTGAPALASATKLIPDPEPIGNPDDTMLVPPAAVAAAAAAAAGTSNGKSDEHTAALPVSKPATAAASAPLASASPRPVAPPPRMQIGREPEIAAATAAGSATASSGAGGAGAVGSGAGGAGAVGSGAAVAGVASGGGAPRGAVAAGGTGDGQSGGVRRIGGNPQSMAALPAFDDQPASRGGFSGRVLPLLIGAIAIAVIVAGIIVIKANQNSTTGNVSHNNSAQTGQSLHRKQSAPVPFRASRVTVAVLNGTAQSGLAGAVGGKLAAQGYKKGNVTNAASQTQSLTFVYYVSDAAAKTNRIAAQHVARALSLPLSRVHKAGLTVTQSCKISATGASLGACNANVIVSVGQDRVSLASGG